MYPVCSYPSQPQPIFHRQTLQLVSPLSYMIFLILPAMNLLFFVLSLLAWGWPCVGRNMSPQCKHNWF
jgi:hypothetical protein